MHQTFQEYLAARHLVIPVAKAIDKAREVAHNPRWHEILRLAAGVIGVIQEDDETVTEFVEALADRSDDPLEPLFGQGLLLAASCIADDVRVRPDAVDAVIVRICEMLPTAYPPIYQAILDRLRAMRSVQPGPEAVHALIKLGASENWNVRMEAARMLARVVANAHDACEAISRLFDEDEDVDVRAHAAYGLWMAKVRRDDSVVRALLKGLHSPHAKLPRLRSSAFVRALVTLLADADAEVRYRAAATLGDWGRKDDALLALLADADASVRYRAAATLGDWGRHATVVARVLEALGLEKVEYLGHYLTRNTATTPFERPDEATTQLLVRALTRTAGDTLAIKMLRAIVFGWAWGEGQGEA